MAGFGAARRRFDPGRRKQADERIFDQQRRQVGGGEVEGIREREADPAGLEGAAQRGYAVAVNYAKTSLSNRFPSGWLYLEGLLFVVVIGFAPMGLAGLVGYARSALDRLRGSPGASPADEAKRLEDEVVPA